MIKNKHSLVDLARYGTEARKNIHSSVLIGDQRTKCPTFKEGDVLDANATLNLILDTYDGSKIFLTFSKEGQLIAERLDHIEQTSDDNNAEIVDMIESVDDKLSAQTQGIRDDVDIIQRQIPGLKRVIDIRLVSDNNGKKTYLVEKQDGDFAYIEIRDGEKGEPFVYNDFTQEQLDQLKVKGDKGDKGDRGVSIVDIKQSQISYSDRGINKLLITLDDGTVTEFLILNGTGIQNARQELDLIHDSIVAQERADRQLQQNIDALTATHQQDLQDIQNNITRLVESLINGAPAALDTLGEIANRLADDGDAISSIVSSITDETSARQSEDAAINSRISQLDLNHQNDISSVIDSVQDELTRASNAENILQLNISNLADIVSTNKTSLENAISEESTRAQDAEALLSQDISELSDVVDSKETAINASISNLADTVSANKTDIEQALASEVNRAQLAEQINASDISSLSSTVETNRQTAAQAVSAEETRARSAEKKVADDLSAYVASNNTALQTEYTRASNAETALDTKIDNEAYLRSSKDTDLLNLINTITGTTLSGYVPKIPSSPRSPEYEASLTSYNKVWVDPNGLVVEGNNPVTLAGHGITDAYTKTEIENKISNLTNDAQVKRSEMGIANGVATLDPNGLVPSSQLPSYVDDVLEYQSLSSFPSTGETGKIYVDTGTSLTYRWSGSTYTEISPSLALGETTSTAYAGNKGKAVRDDFDSHNNDTTRHITSTERNAWNAKYDKPSTGIPSTDMSSAVQSSLNLANTALQSHLSAATIATNLTALGYALTDTNTWRPITNNYIGSDQDTSLSLYGANALYNALINGYASSAGSAEYAKRLDGGGIARWGTLTSSNGYSGIAAYDWNDRGAFCWAGKNGQMCMQVDGFFYQNEGRYKCIDEGNISSQSVSYATSAGSATYCLRFSKEKSTYNANEVSTGIIDNYDSPGHWVNAPGGMSYGSIISLASPNYGKGLGMQLAWDTNHNNSAGTRYLWFRTGNNLGWSTNWKRIATTEDIPSTISWSNVTGKPNYLPLSGGTLTGKATASGGLVVRTSDAGKFVVAPKDNSANNATMIRFIGNGIRILPAESHILEDSENSSQDTATNYISIGHYTNTHSPFFSIYDSGQGKLREVIGILSLSNPQLTIGKGYDNRVTNIYGQNVRLYSINDSGSSVEVFASTKAGNVRIGTGGDYATYKLAVAGTVGATSFANTSDIRKKNIIENVSFDVQDIANAPLFKFTWVDPDMDDMVNVGTSAQYWETVVPELITKSSDDMNTLSMLYGVTGLASAIVLARKVVEQEKTIESQEQRIKALEDAIAEIKNLLNNRK